MQILLGVCGKTSLELLHMRGEIFSERFYTARFMHEIKILMRNSRKLLFLSPFFLSHFKAAHRRCYVCNKCYE